MICGVTLVPTSVPARVLSVGPLTFVGRISYGLYLWHWPVFLVLNHARTGLEDYRLFALRVAVTFVVAVLSWYLVETPVRQMKFGSWRSWAWVPVGVVAVVVVLVVTTVSSGEASVLGNPTALEAGLITYETATFPTQGSKAQGPLRRRLTLVDRRVRMAPVRRSTTEWCSVDALWTGCGLATAVPYDLHGTPTYPLAPCADWPTIVAVRGR